MKLLYLDSSGHAEVPFNGLHMLLIFLLSLSLSIFTEKKLSVWFKKQRGPRIKKKKMNPKLQKAYKENRQILVSLIGLEIKSAIEEQYFFEGKLDEDSRGTLKLELSNGEEITFNCDGDGESIKIKRGGFVDKGTLETDFEDERYNWKENEYLNYADLKSLGQIEKTEIEILTLNKQEIQSGCRLSFQNGAFLHV